jgi:hypothetical protein
LVLLAIVLAREGEGEREGERSVCGGACCVVKSPKPATFVATGLHALAVTLEACREHLKLVNILS